LKGVVGLLWCDAREGFLCRTSKAGRQ